MTDSNNRLSKGLYGAAGGGTAGFLATLAVTGALGITHAFEGRSSLHSFNFAAETFPHIVKYSAGLCALYNGLRLSTQKVSEESKELFEDMDGPAVFMASTLVSFKNALLISTALGLHAYIGETVRDNIKDVLHSKVINVSEQKDTLPPNSLVFSG